MRPRLLPSALVAVSLALSLSCSRTDPNPPRLAAPPSSVAGRPAESPAPVQPALSPLSSGLSRPMPERLIAIGDLHGDLAATRRALRLAGAIDEADHWSGGSLVVVQTGDCIDRGDDDRAVLDLLQRLREEAHRAGGELILLNGNHELMNVAQDFRYVSQTSLAQFNDQGGRAAAFAPAGSYARMLATQGLFMKVGDSVFVHGGILAKHVAYGLDRMDAEVRAWERGDRPHMPEPVVDPEGPVWTRFYSLETTPEICEQLRQVLFQLSAERMVVGHTVQPQGMNSACDGMVWRIDVGLSKFYGGPMQVLDLSGGLPRVLSEEPPVAPPIPEAPPTYGPPSPADVGTAPNVGASPSADAPEDDKP